MRLDHLTWEEIEEYLQKKKSLMIPIGICEQHSKHLPLNTDTLIAEYLAQYLSDKLDILIAPTFHYGVGLPCDRFFPGSTTISKHLLKEIISELIHIWKNQGFEQFFLLTYHGDPFHIQALQEIPDSYLLELYKIDYKGILEKQEGPKHAGEAETSVMLYLYPEKVLKNKIEDFEIPFEKFKDYLYHKKNEPIKGSPGCLGYPSYAHKRKGKKIVQLMKKNALDWILKYHKQYK